jgi:CRP/FNR family cyclic AMP-dependent transcriptional regulator
MSSIGILRNEGDSRAFSAGETIFNAGDAGDYMYVVAKGELEVRAGDRLIETIGEGSIVGEMALIDKEPRSASVVAKTDCELVPVDERRFLRLVQHTPFFAIQVMKILTQRLRQRTAQA